MSSLGRAGQVVCGNARFSTVFRDARLVGPEQGTDVAEMSSAPHFDGGPHRSAQHGMLDHGDGPRERDHLLTRL
jgi:hypothetical protein